MRRIRVLFILFEIYLFSESVKIEFPSNRYIKDNIRQDAKVTDPIFRYYITRREVEFQIDSSKTNLPYFLQCQGSKKSLQLFIPNSAKEHLLIDKNLKTHTVTARLKNNRLTIDLVGRYTCSETTIDHRSDETSVHVFIEDKQSLFTKTQYPTIYEGTGIHFFTIPCQTTSWLSENMPISFTPSNIRADKVLFDRQIGFALINPRIPKNTREITCKIDSSSKQQARIPYAQREPDELTIEQQHLTIMSNEILRLTCGIQYSIRDYQKQPTVFWFQNTENLDVFSNQTDLPPSQNGYGIQNTSIVLGGFQAEKTYQFYCVRNSDGRVYSKSIIINSTKTPIMELSVNLDEAHLNGVIHHGSNAIYNINIFTIPRQLIKPDIMRDGKSLENDKRFELKLITNREDQFFDYDLIIHNITFEDEAYLNITARSRELSKSATIRPNITGPPLGQLAFLPTKSSSNLPWRHENPTNAYAHGISFHEQYHIACIIRHSSDFKQSLDVTIRSFRCSTDNCLLELSTKTCQTPSDESRIETTLTRTSQYQTEFISTNSYTINDPSISRQYVCCYRHNGHVNSLTKALAIASNNSAMFHIDKPEFGLVIGDTVTYRCEIHRAIYNDLQIIYNNGLKTYEKKSSEQQWHLRGGRRENPAEITWKLLSKNNNRRTIVEIKTKPLVKVGEQGYIQCIGLSKRPDLIPNKNQTYFISAQQESQLRFVNDAPTVSTLARKAGDNIELDCLYSGQPKPKLLWRKGKIPLDWQDTAMKSRDDNQKIYVDRAQAADTGYYTCELNNGRGPILLRSFDLRVQGPNPKSKLGLLVSIVTTISSLLVLLMLCILITFLVKFFKMKRNVHKSTFYKEHGSGNIVTDQPVINQLERVQLPKNFAHQTDIRTLLNFVNSDQVENEDDFKRLGEGNFGVVYQVRLPNAGLVAAKMLPEKIRSNVQRRNKLLIKKTTDEKEQMISVAEDEKRKAVEMLISEIKVMYKAGQHLNIVAFKVAAYPVSNVRLLITGGSTLREEDSFYLMELCSNGSLENLLKIFPPNSFKKPSLYDKLFREPQLEMTVDKACEQCDLTEDDLVLIAYQVATGADYLNRRQIVHCDIAARNVLVTSRFIIKICDFGLATSTTYKNYQEQLQKNENVHLDATKSDQIPAHGITPELVQEYERRSISRQNSSVMKSSMKADVWSFGIFLWTLFLKCRVKPYYQLEEKLKQYSKKFFYRELSRIVTEGQVVRYMDYRPEIPRPIYWIIRECLLVENRRPEMKQIRTYLCDLVILSRKAFEFYGSEFNRYEAAHTTSDQVVLFDGVQGRSGVPSFDGDNDDDISEYLQPNLTTTQNNNNNNDLYYSDDSI